MSKIKFLFTIIIHAFVIISCYQHQEYKVEYAGALKTIMHDADISAKINLSRLSDLKHLYGLGAVENLKGEIIIIHGEPLVSSVVDSSLHLSSTFDIGASLLVFSQVSNWKEYSVPAEINNLETFETFLIGTAKENGIDINYPFPFLVSGKVERACWHVIDWADGDTVHTHEKHKNAGLHGSLENEVVTILGFYSDKHKGIFTHMSSDLHMHVVNSSKTIAGHLDDVKFYNNSLFLPVENN